MGEDDVDFIHEVFDEADVVASAGDDDGVGAFVVGDGDEGAELVGTGHGGDFGADVAHDSGLWPGGGLGCGGGLTGEGDLAGADGLGGGFLGGVGLAGDELGEERGDVFGGGVFEIEDLVAGVGVGFDVELGDELVEERILARVGDEDDLVGAVVGVVGRAGAELVLKRALQDGAELVDEVGGLGGFQRVEFWVETGGGGTIEGFDEALDALEITHGISDERGVGFFQDDDTAADAGGKQALELGHELVDAEKIELEDFRGDLARCGLVRCRAQDHFRGLGLGLG